VSAAPLARPRAGQRLGRFRLLSELGRGAQAEVWRALDERLQREVALKLMTPGGDAAQADRWLFEARAVGRLAHPHIVPVFEADNYDGQPALVFEMVEGQTLAQRLKQSGPMPAREAVELMVGVVDALRAAHAQGIVHRDLKPSNILLDSEGRARVMDFGIAAQLTAPQPGDVGMIAGTPGYISPEAARADAPHPLMDVFAAGLVLAELVTGRPMMREAQVQRALQRVQDEDLQVADDAPVDDRLRAVLQRAIARNPAQRYDSAASLRDALMQWLQPPEDGAPEAASGHGTLDFLLRRMRYKSDFPALSDGVLRIQRLSSSETDSLQSMADEILKDVALTQKLLRLVNTAHFRRGEHGVSTVSRAVALVGQAGIRNLALSLVLVEHMKDKAHAQRLKEAFLRALLAGQLAHELSPSGREAEEAFLGAMFYNLGPLLTEYYFPDEAQTVREELARRAALEPAGRAGRSHPDVLADQVAAQVMGLGFEALGLGVARHWGLPEGLQRCMRRPDTASPGQRLPAGTERARWLAVAANEAAAALWDAHDDDLPHQLDGVVQRHGRALGLAGHELRRASDEARRTMGEMATALGLAMPAPKRGPALAAVVAPASEAAALGAAQEADTLLLPSALGAPTVVMAHGQLPEPPLPSTAELLGAGIQDIADTLAGDTVKLNDVLRMVLETIYRALDCERVVFCLREANGQRLVGRFGLGVQAPTLAPLFQIALKPLAGEPPSLFTAVCLKGEDSLVPDVRHAAIAKLVPAWHQRHVPAHTLLLLPLVLRNAPLALIYADRLQPFALAERERALLRTLRNQAVMAFRQAGH